MLPVIAQPVIPLSLSGVFAISFSEITLSQAMASQVLAIAVGFSSVILFIASFFFPEVHRRGDLVLSWFMLFFALVLWFYQTEIQGGLLAGEAAGVLVLIWFGAQSLALRRATTPKKQRTPLPQASPVARLFRKLPFVGKAQGSDDTPYTETEKISGPGPSSDASLSQPPSIVAPTASEAESLVSDMVNSLDSTFTTPASETSQGSSLSEAEPPADNPESPAPELPVSESSSPESPAPGSSPELPPSESSKA